MKTPPVNLLLGHGASGNAASMRPWIGALGRHSITAKALQLPKGHAERAALVFAKALVEHPQAAIGGHSYGGRAASLLASTDEATALILLSYPLHRPGHPEELRSQHWKNIDAPVLLLSGDRDPFAQIDLLRREVRKLKHATLYIYPGLGHGVIDEINDAADRIAKFLRQAKAK